MNDMSNNASEEESDNMNISFPFEEVLVLPEFIDLTFLILGVIGMYQGIEISHPLYAVLFLNLIMPIIFSIVNIIGFTFMPQVGYVILANTNNTISLFFHCTCWCVTSLIGYLYIIEPDKLHKIMPNVRIQCFAALLLTITFACFLTLPMIGYGLHIGKDFF
jgi:hypothetical protein